MVLFLNTKFPRTEKKYAKEAEDNSDRLKDLMSKLLLQEQAVAQPSKPVAPPKTGGTTKPAYSYAERKKAKTFRL